MDLVGLSSLADPRHFRFLLFGFVALIIFMTVGVVAFQNVG